MSSQPKLSSVFSEGFFGLLASKNRDANFLLLAETDRTFGKGGITIERKKLVESLAEFIKIMHLESIGAIDDVFPDEEDPIEAINPQGKASMFVRSLERRGWLDQDQDEDLNPIVSRSDAFVAVFNAVSDLIAGETDTKETAVQLVLLYQSVMGFKLDNATTSMQAIENASKGFEREVLSINSRIKRFVSKTMSDSSLTEKDILSKLTVEYARLTAYIAFHNLLTRNNPRKYRNDMLAQIDKLSSPDMLDAMVTDYFVTKRINNPGEEDRSTAIEYFRKVLRDVENQIIDVDESLDIISGRNRAYVRSSSDRIRFRLNNEKDIKGEITGILKRIKAVGDSADEILDAPFSLYSLEQSDPKSLFSPRSAARIAPKKVPFVSREVSEEAMAKAAEIIRVRNAYSIDAVNKFVLEAFGKRKRIRASEISIEDDESLVRLILIPVYSSNSLAQYTIGLPMDEQFHTHGFAISDYEIRPKEAQQ